MRVHREVTLTIICVRNVFVYLTRRATMNGLASKGEYTGEEGGDAAADSNFVKAHAY